VQLSKFEADRLQQRKAQHKALVAQPKVSTCVLYSATTAPAMITGEQHPKELLGSSAVQIIV
jgi:hypothetical protein